MVLHVLARRQRALGDSAGAIHDTSGILVEAMPVDTSGLVAQTIVHVYDQAITDVHVNLRARPLAIDTDDGSLESIGGGVDPGHVPVQEDVLSCS